MSSSPKVIFLFGAGASIPAGLPDIRQLTKSFEKKELSKESREAYQYVKNVLSEKMGTEIDLEHILTTLTLFVTGSRETIHYFYKQPEEELSKHKNEFHELVKSIKSHLRDKLEVQTNSDYLLGLKGFVEQFKKVEIFTLNYDSVIETFCEVQGIDYTDGFDLYWNPEKFNLDYGVNLYKLHGSLYWFKTEKGKLVKIPLKKLDPNKVLYYSDVDISDESMIYPTAVKELELNPYSFLRNSFIQILPDTDLLVVVGYSFRDQGWLNIVKDQLKSNKSLWILIADINPTKIKGRLVQSDKDLLDRIVTFTGSSQEAFGSRILNNKIDSLLYTMQEEREYLSKISRSSYLDYSQLYRIVTQYKRLNHFSRIKSLAEQIFATPTTRKRPEFNLINELFPFSLMFGLENCVQEDWVHAELWFQIFSSFLLNMEFNYAKNQGYEREYKSKLKMEVGIEEMPWSKNRIASGLLDSAINIELEIVNKIKSPEVKSKISNLIESAKNFNSMLKVSGGDPRFPHKKREFFDKLQRKGGTPLPIRNLLEIIASMVYEKDSLVSEWDSSSKLFFFEAYKQA